ncbi:hypothetical protein BHM03_00002791 [Ensete ventricosum]|nr:hypothetical protein BHM03_00002791 [Ensete ventricosum]
MSYFKLFLVWVGVDTIPSPPLSPTHAADHHLPFSSSTAFLPCLPATGQPSIALLYRNLRRTPLPHRCPAALLPSLSQQSPTPAILNCRLLSSYAHRRRCRRPPPHGLPSLPSPLLPAAFPPTIATVVIFLSSFPTAAATRRRCPLPWLPLPPSAASVPLFPLLLSSLFQPLPSSLTATITPLYSACTLLPLSLQPPQSPPRLCPPLPPRSPLFLPFAPHDTTASSLAVAALAVVAAFKCAPALLSSSITTVSHSSPPIATSVATLIARQPLVISSRSNSLYSNRCPSLTIHMLPLPSPLASSSSISHLCSSLPSTVVQPLPAAAIFPRSHSRPPLQRLQLASSVVAAATTTSSAALLCHRGHLCSSPLLLTTPLPSLLSLRPSLLQPLSNVPLPCSPPQSLPPTTLLYRQQHQPQPSSPVNHLPLLVAPTPSATTVAPPLRRKLMPLTRQQKKELNIIDLQSYIMTTDDAFDARFKIFEARMEDRFQELLCEIRRSRSESPKKTQHGESSKGSRSEKCDQG